MPGLSEGKWYQSGLSCSTRPESPSHHPRPNPCRHKNLAPSIDKGQADQDFDALREDRVLDPTAGAKPPSFLVASAHGVS